MSFVNQAHPGMQEAAHSCSGSATAAPAAGYQAPAVQWSQMSADERKYPYGAGDYGVSPAAGFRSWFEFSNAGYLKGLLAGAGVTLLLTNSDVQKALMRGTVKLWSTIQGGVEEVKEQFKDVKAEMSQES
jgi:hypothetical protein